MARVGVLPFQGPPDDPETEVNGRAMANSIVSVLTQIADLDVAYPMTPGWFDSARPSDADTARELKADYLVTGGFAKGSEPSAELSGAWIRITETKSGSVLLARMKLAGG